MIPNLINTMACMTQFHTNLIGVKAYMLYPAAASSGVYENLIKNKIKDNSITFDEINCVLAFVKSKDKKRNICHIIKWYKKAYCSRKCYFNKEQIKECSAKLNYFASQNPKLGLTRNEFLELFDNHLNICVLPENKKKEYVSWNEFKARLTSRPL